MDRAVNIILAALVLAVGAAVALLCRTRTPAGGYAPLDNDTRLVLRGPRWERPPQTSPVSGKTHSAKPATSTTDANPAALCDELPAPRGPKSTVLAPIDTGRAPPRLAQVFPHGDESLVSPWAHALARQTDADPRQEASLPPLIHKIVDGDTLESLALHYLGNSSRWPEIYEANRQLLLDSDTLPIGGELLIPSAGKPLRASDGLLPEKPLVPVVPKRR